MNERIKELAVSSGFKEDRWGLFAPGIESSTLDDELEAFAELIVRECCDLVREIDAMEIRKHFGIKP